MSLLKRKASNMLVVSTHHVEGGSAAADAPAEGALPLMVVYNPTWVPWAVGRTRRPAALVLRGGLP